MNCREIEDRILESLDSSPDAAQRAELAEHISGCESCRRFQEVQLSLDRALAVHCVAPAPRAGMAERVRRLAAAERKRALWDAAPDLLHLGGGVAGTLVTAALVPLPPAMVLAAGLGFTLLTYFPHVLFRAALERLDE